MSHFVYILAKAEEGSQVAEEAEKRQESQFVFAFFSSLLPLCESAENTDGVAR